MSAARRRGFELPVVRVVVERAPGLGRERGRPLRTPQDAARVLAPFLEQAPPTQRLALALLDARERLLAVALLDGAQWRACCLRPSEVYEPALVAGATSLYLAHRHPSKEPWAGRADCDSLEGLGRLGQALGLRVRDHLIFGAGGHCASLRASQHVWWGWRHESLMRRWPLPSCADGDTRARGALRGADRRRSVARSAVPTASANRAGRGLAHGPRFSLCGLHARVDYDEPGLRLARRTSVHTHADVAPALADGLVRHRGTVAAGLLDAARRLLAVAVIGGARGAGCACEAVEPESVYRTAIACGAHALFLAHHHSALETQHRNPAGEWTARAYALGCDLGLELRDHLLFGVDAELGLGGRHYVSLRALGRGAPDWRKGADLAAPPDRLRLHQAMWNRRPQRPALTRSLSARAALRVCAACGRRSAIKAACPWCNAPRLRTGAGGPAHDRAA